MKRLEEAIKAKVTIMFPDRTAIMMNEGVPVVRLKDALKLHEDVVCIKLTDLKRASKLANKALKSDSLPFRNQAKGVKEFIEKELLGDAL